MAGTGNCQVIVFTVSPDSPPPTGRTAPDRNPSSRTDSVYGIAIGIGSGDHTTLRTKLVDIGGWQEFEGESIENRSPIDMSWGK
ncbi:hypothetical protein GWI33_011983 [Rhynchophorus ferrugineus]|uniref:Uncharacterized protein n=1 Tax=Rhynchophorus ferrugineus TaxID=354439 RepID=A0A834J1G5_RHYFE|nr:hypothetical protein GWI33_011983 [Rhynchophorus ferrugineus]